MFTLTCYSIIKKLCLGCIDNFRDIHILKFVIQLKDKPESQGEKETLLTIGFFNREEKGWNMSDSQYT